MVLTSTTEIAQFDKPAIRLFNTLERQGKNTVKEFLIKDYLKLPVSVEMEEETHDYFVTHSVISAAAMANPGTSVITEILYDELNTPSPLDKYFLQSQAGKAIKARLISIEETLPHIIEEYRSKGNVLIANLGSGPGKDVTNILYHYRNNSNSEIKAIYIDKDKVALEKGKRIAISKGVNHLIEFVQSDFLRYKTDHKFDIAILIGVLCPLSIEDCITYLKMIRKSIKGDGCLIAGNASKKMLKNDPFTCYLMEKFANWRLVFKDEKEIKQIFNEAGYSWRGCFSDSYGFHIMGMGSPTTI